MSKRNLLIGIVALALLVAGLVWFQRKPEEATEQAVAGDPNIVELSAEAQRNANLEVAEVSERPMQRTLVATGVVAADQNREAHLRPLARGVAESVLVKLGDRVERGASLLAYDNIELGELSGEFLALRAELERQQAQAEVARRSMERGAALLQVEAIAQKEYELREAEYRQAVAATNSTKASMARVEEKLHRLGLTDADLETLGGSNHGTHRTASHNVLRAPFAGVITKYDAAPGEVLEPDREVFTLVDTSVVWVLADIYEKDLGQVRIGQTARVTVPAYPEEAFTGRITYIGDVLDPSSRTAKLRCVVQNTDGRLKIEMFATVEIPLPMKRSAIAVPGAAVQVVGNQQVVFVQKDATHFEKRVIETGERSGDWIEIRSGLRPGERVVTTGAFYVKSALLKDQISGEE
mgnify:FL=1